MPTLPSMYGSLLYIKKDRAPWFKRFPPPPLLLTIVPQKKNYCHWCPNFAGRRAEGKAVALLDQLQQFCWTRPQPYFHYSSYLQQLMSCGLVVKVNSKTLLPFC